MLADNFLKSCVRPFCTSENVNVEIKGFSPAENGQQNQALQTSQPPASSDLQNVTPSFGFSSLHEALSIS